jgi:hypothetical protein
MMGVASIVSSLDNIAGGGSADLLASTISSNLSRSGELYTINPGNPSFPGSPAKASLSGASKALNSSEEVRRRITDRFITLQLQESVFVLKRL